MSKDEEIPLQGTQHTLDEAIELTGNGKYHYFLLFVTGLASMSVLVEAQCMGIVLPAARCDLNITIGEQGFINSVAYIGIIISSHFWGFMTDTWGRMKTLKITLLLSVICSVISGLSLTSWMLLLSRFIVGICTSGVKISALAYLGEFHSNKTRAKYFTLLVSVITVGIIMQTLLALAIIPSDFEIKLFSFLMFRPWRLYIMAGNVISGAALVGILFLPEGPKYTYARGQENETLEILKSVYSINTGRPKDTYPVRHIVKLESSVSNISDVHNIKDAVLLIWNQTWPIFRPPHISSMIILCILSFIMFGVGQAFEVWYPQILTFYTNHIGSSITMCQAVESHMKPATINASSVATDAVSCKLVINTTVYNVILVMGVFYTVLGFCMGHLIGVINTNLMLTTWTVVTSIGAFSVFLATNFYVSNISAIVMTSTVFLINVIAPLGSELFPIKYKGMAISLIFMCGRAGSVVGINLIALLLEQHCNVIFGLSFTVLLSATGACYFIFRRAERCQKEEIFKANLNTDIKS